MSRLLIAGILGLLGPLTQDDPLPVPSDEALAQAEKTIREVFREEYGVRTGTAELKLAKKFVEQGLQTREDPALKYVLLREAGELALAAGDMETLIAALDQLCSLFAVSAVPLRQGFLGRAEPRLTKPEDFKRLADAELRLVPDYLEQDLFDLAGATAQSALSAAKKSKDIPLISRADTALRSSSDQKAAFEKARKADKDLEANPQDPVANAVRGEYWCLHRGRWDQGLECLAKGGDLGLKTLAQKELARPTDAGPLVELADGWWDLSEKEKSPLKKRHLSVHAASLYERALPLTEGLTKVRIENRMAAVAPASGTTAAKVHREGLIAWWKFDEGKGATTVNAAGAATLGTLNGGVDWTPGRFGTALKFDGVSGFVSCPTEGLPSTNAAQTLSFWLKWTKLPTHTETVICMADKRVSGGLQAGFRDGTLCFWRWGGLVLMTAPVPSLDAWHHLAYTYDGTQHLLYIDGKLASQSTAAAPAGVIGRCEFGRYWALKNEAFSGQLDDVRIYKRALAEAELLGLSAGTD
ncbi:MAG TPA: LamG domain-containing protein [Planctomycetota bacterium]|nr:LamG domain-containing protein [Planctomycetota bacterium]